MKKVIIALILIGIAVIAGAPYANGLIMEMVAKKASADLNKLYSETGSGLAIDIIDYNRSFSSSRVKWKVNLGNFKSIYGVEEIIIIEQAEHGYTGVVSKSSLAENKWFTDFVDQKLHGKNPLDITTRYNLLGQIESTVTLGAFSHNDGTDTFQVKPGKMVISCGKEFKSFSYNGAWEGIEVPDQLKIERVSVDANMEKLSTYIWQGDGSIKITRCEAAPDNEPLEVSNFICDYVMNFEKQDNTLSMGIDYGVDRFAFEGKSIDNAFIHIGINRIDANGYENFMKLYTQLIQDAMGSLTAAQNDPEQVEAIMQQQMAAKATQLVPALEKILKTGLEIQVSDLKVTLPEGNIKGGIALSLKKDLTMAQLLPIINQPKIALDIISLQSAMSLPASLVGDNPALLSPVYRGMQTGLFEKNGPQVVHMAETKDGKLFLNGREVILD